MSYSAVCELHGHGRISGGFCSDCGADMRTEQRPLSGAPPIAKPAAASFLTRHRVVSVRRNIEAFKLSIDAWSELEWAAAAAGEVGELCNAVKKRKRAAAGFNDGRAVPTIDDVGGEIADVICYLDLLAAKLGIDLEQAIIRKFNAVSERVGSKERL